MFPDRITSKFYGGVIFLSSGIILRFVRSLITQPWRFGQLKRPRATLLNAIGGQTDPTSYPFLHIAEYPDDDFSHVLGYGISDHTPSNLQKISKLKIEEVIRLKRPIDTQGCGIDRTFYISSDDLLEEIGDFDEQYGAPYNLYERLLASYPRVAIAAEFKRASPSKGDINIKVNIVDQCLMYAEAGAAVVSVLTEYRHFKGTLDNMKTVRKATQARLKSDRPLILRKDFIFDRYQILEARAYGADTVLLIVAVLGVDQLTDLIGFTRKQGMEPLVEVHTDREMEIALDCGARVIGVNNRNLHSFQLDLKTTERILQVAQRKQKSWRIGGSSEPDLLIAALSGITSSEDVQYFHNLGVSCCLVGETLMKSNDPRATILSLFAPPKATSSSSSSLLVKTCGMTDVDDVRAALQAGANLIGVIFATKSPRKASVHQAVDIVAAVRQYGERTGSVDLSIPKEEGQRAQEWFSKCAQVLKRVTTRQPLVVGVFQDQPIDEVNSIIEQSGVDLAQLHGKEDVAYMAQVRVPCIKVIHIPAKPTTTQQADEGIDHSDVMEQVLSEVNAYNAQAYALLFDSKLPGAKTSGGSGQVFDWSLVEKLEGVPVLLAGGLSSDNVSGAGAYSGVFGVDVSSGIEQAQRPGVKDRVEMKVFIENAKAAAM